MCGRWSWCFLLPFSFKMANKCLCVFRRGRGLELKLKMWLQHGFLSTSTWKERANLETTPFQRCSRLTKVGLQTYSHVIMHTITCPRPNQAPHSRISRTFLSSLYRGVFNWVSKVIPQLLWFCIATLCDWLKILAPLPRPIRSKTKTNRDLLARVFPRLARATCICFELWLVHWIVYDCCDWSE